MQNPKDVPLKWLIALVKNEILRRKTEVPNNLFGLIAHSRQRLLLQCSKCWSRAESEWPSLRGIIFDPLRLLY